MRWRSKVYAVVVRYLSMGKTLWRPVLKGRQSGGRPPPKEANNVYTLYIRLCADVAILQMDAVEHRDGGRSVSG